MVRISKYKKSININFSGMFTFGGKLLPRMILLHQIVRMLTENEEMSELPNLENTYWVCVVIFIVKFSSVPQSCPPLCDPMKCTIPGSRVHHQLPELAQTHHMSIESVMPSNHLILCRPLHLLLSIFPSIRDFSSESVFHIRGPIYWSFSYNVSPSSEHSGLISLRMDWLNFLAVQGTLKKSSPIPQFKSINSLVLSFLYSSTLTSIHDYWKSHSLD